MKMKTLALLSLSLAVALGMPPFAPGVVQNPALTEEDQSPLLGDRVPLQGHVVVEDPAPQVRPGSKEQQEKLAPVPVDIEQSIVELELEIKVKPQVVEEQEGGVKTEVKKEPEVKPELKDKPEPEVEPEPEAEVEQKLKADPEVEPESEVKVDLKVDVEPEVNLNPEVMAELKIAVKPELNNDPDLKVESEAKLKPDVQEEFQVQMNLEAKTETGQEIEERHIDMEGKYEMVGELIMELEPLDDDNTELSEVEKSLRATFMNENPVNHPLPEEGELHMREMDGEPIMELEPLDDDNTELSDMEKSLRAAFQNQEDSVLDGEPIMELEPEEEEPSLHQHIMPDDAIMDGPGPALDIMGQPMPSLEEYFPNEEARMGMEHGKQQYSRTEGSDYMMMEEPGSEFVGEEELSPVAMKDDPVLDGGVQIGVAPIREKRALKERLSPNQDKQGQSHCPGVILEEKCYQFFKGPKAAADAEFFCQEHFAGGHLASITSQHIHREVMNMMLQQNGAHARTWIGGLRYLETGRFLWLDGSHWNYADWLSGEPNDTAGVEDCVEVLAHGNGKFNDFTCWEPQAFICSYPY